MLPEPKPDDEQKREEVSAALMRIAAGVEAYDLKQVQDALGQWNEIVHPKKAEEK